MKQIDNRQKQQILMRAQKTFLGGKNPLAPKDKDKERQASHAVSQEKESSGDKKAEVSSQAPVHRSEPKVGRNDPCPCGSGKKFKKCCLK